MELNLDQQVYNQLRDMIFRYEIFPGQKLQYQDLADKLGVSRTPVKNALNFLEKDGLVRLAPNKGFYVNELSVEEAQELFDLRVVLEVEAVRLAIQKFSDDGYGELEKIENQFETMVEQELTRGRFFVDRDFHLQVAVMSGNRALHKCLKHVLEMTFLRHRIELLSNKRGYEVRHEHRRIMQAIESRDEKAAVKSVRYHIQRHRENIISIL